MKKNVANLEDWAICRIDGTRIVGRFRKIDEVDEQEEMYQDTEWESLRATLIECLGSEERWDQIRALLLEEESIREANEKKDEHHTTTWRRFLKELEAVAERLLIRQLARDPQFLSKLDPTRVRSDKIRTFLEKVQQVA